MKNSITNMWLLSLVVIFIFIFSAYLAITVNYSMAFKVKNEVLDIIEKRKGIKLDDSVVSQPAKIGSGTVKVPNSALGVINVYLTGSGYKTKGTCSSITSDSTDDKNWYGVKESTNSSGPVLSVDEPDVVKNSNKKYYWCFRKRQTYCSSSCKTGNNHSFIYEVMFFYKMDLPVLGDLFTFRVEGTTNEIYFVNDSLSKCTCT